MGRVDAALQAQARIGERHLAARQPGREHAGRRRRPRPATTGHSFSGRAGRARRAARARARAGRADGRGCPARASPACPPAPGRAARTAAAPRAAARRSAARAARACRRAAPPGRRARARRPAARRAGPAQHVGAVQGAEVEVGDDGRGHARMVAARHYSRPLVPTFCRHNRFVADCPICSKGTVLDPAQQAPRRRQAPSRSGARRAAKAGGRHGAHLARAVRVRGPLRRRGGAAGARARRAAAGLVARRSDRAHRPGARAQRPARPARRGGRRGAAAARRRRRHGAAAEPGRLRRRAPAAPASCATSCASSAVEDDRVRVARWIMRPNRGWELQEAPVMLPPQALRRGARGRRRACSSGRRRVATMQMCPSRS